MSALSRIFSILLLFFLFFSQISHADSWSIETSNFIKTPTSVQNVQCLKTYFKEDYDLLCQHLERIESHFDKVKNRLFQNSQNNSYLIPPLIHFIWIGPHDLPQNYIENIESWRKYHPSYEIILWTDRERINLPSGINVRMINDLSLQMQNEFNHSVTFAEKSNILRYEILNQIGGIYIDTDVICHASFDGFTKNYGFFIGVEDVWPMIENHFLKTCNCVMGSAAQHPLWNEVINKIKDNWRVNTEFVRRISMDWELNEYLIMVRSFRRSSLPFTDTVLNWPYGDLEILVPPKYFGLHGTPPTRGIYCTHLYDGTWKDEK
jgi:mannosyltransferase OCH1-like enzyme